MLRVEHLDVCIGSRVLLSKFCVSWPFGTFIALVGPNGSGKTTLLNHLCGLSLKSAKKVFLEDVDLLGMTPKKRAALISSIAQHDSAPLETRACDRIAHGLYASGRNNQTIEVVARELGIHDLLHRPLYSLSGGQRKKVHIARALVNHARVFILDEPDAHLDESSREQLMSVLAMRAEHGTLVIAALHHRDLAEKFAHQVLDLQTLLRAESRP